MYGVLCRFFCTEFSGAQDVFQNRPILEQFSKKVKKKDNHGVLRWRARLCWWMIMTLPDSARRHPWSLFPICCT